jgi:tetratricopeptide (TPR) repeat protein
MLAFPFTLFRVLSNRMSTAAQPALKASFFLLLMVYGLGMPALAITKESYQAYQQALAFERNGQLPSAEGALRKAVALDPDDPFNMTKLAGVLASQGKTQEAIGIYQRAITLNPQDTMLPFSLGTLYEQAGQYPLALQAYEKALQANPTYRFGLLNTARVLTHLNKADRAIADYTAFLQAYPEHYEGRRYLGKLLLATNHAPQAIEQFRFMQSHFDQKFSDHLDLARALNGSQNPQQALTELQTALTRATHNKADVYAEMARAHTALKQTSMAVAAYDKAYAAAPARVELLEQKAQLLRTTGDWPQAETAYLAYLDKAPQDNEARYDLALVYLAQKQFEQAIPYLQQALGANPPIQAARKDLAYALHMQGRLIEAVPLYEALLAEEASTTPPADRLQMQQNLAIAYHQTQQFDKALALYRQLHTLQPQNKPLQQDFTAVLLRMGDEARKQGDATQALSLYEEANVVNAGQNLTPLLAEAQVYTEQQRWSDAERLYNDILSKDPTNAEAKLFQTQRALKEGNMPRANQLLQQLQTLPIGSTPEYAVLVGDVARQQGQTGQALAAYEKAVGLNPNQPRWWVAVGETAQAGSQHLKAIQAYQKALGLYPPNDANQAAVFYNVGVSYYETQQWDAAERAFAQALQLNPNMPPALYGMATALEAQNKRAQALVAYQQYRNLLPSNSPDLSALDLRMTSLRKQMQVAKPAAASKKTVTTKTSVPAVPVGQSPSITGLQSPAASSSAAPRMTIEAVPAAPSPGLPPIMDLNAVDVPPTSDVPVNPQGTSPWTP